VWQADTGFEGGMTNPGIGGFVAAPGGREGGPGGPGGFGGGRGGFGGFGGFWRGGLLVSHRHRLRGSAPIRALTARALIGVAASDGKFLWRYDAPANRMGINCSTPIYHDGLVFAASAYGAGGGLVKLGKDASGAVKAEEVYATRRMQNHHGGMILHDGCLYGANGGNEGGYLICLDFKNGNVLWDERDEDKRRAPKGSVAMADGRLYYRTREAPSF